MKRAIIIGASSGIGHSLAVALAESGWRIGIAARRTEPLQAIESRFGSGKVAIAAMDVLKPDAVEALDALIERVGEPDLFLYVSGKGGQNPSLDEKLELDIVKTNCEGMVRIVDHFVNYVKSTPYYTRKNRAHIAVVTSVAGTMGMGSAPSYSA